MKEGRLSGAYALKSDTMGGKLQMQMPGQTSWNTYLEWSGSKK